MASSLRRRRTAPPTTLLRAFSHSSRASSRLFTLNTGAIIPAIGLGTFQDPDQQEDAVATALGLGYRHIDTARVYDTEKQVGQGIRRSGVPRDQIFVTTKLWCNDHHPEDVERGLDASLQDMKLDYVDLLLMHYPCTFKRGPIRFPREDASGEIIPGETTYIDTWKAMEELISTGKVKAVGISNFSKAEVENIMKHGSITPAVHQMELHPYLAQHSFTNWHKEQNIQVMHFSPLGNQNTFYKHAQQMPKVIDDSVLGYVARKYKKSPVQMALAWGVNKGRCVISKSTIEWQLKENLSADFEIAEEDMRLIDAIDRKLRFNYKGLNYGWDLYADLEGVGNSV